MHNSFYEKERRVKTIERFRCLPRKQCLDGNRSQDKYIEEYTTGIGFQEK